MKKISKYICLILCAAILALGLCACSKTCKASGCSEKVYKDGYCEAHYALNQLGSLFG